jgi:hypothetical protein
MEYGFRLVHNKSKSCITNPQQINFSLSFDLRVSMRKATDNKKDYLRLALRDTNVCLSVYLSVCHSVCQSAALVDCDKTCNRNNDDISSKLISARAQKDRIACGLHHILGIEETTHCKTSSSVKFSNTAPA